VKEYLATLNDAAFGAASEVTPKFVSPSDPAAQWTGAMRGPAFFAYADNYLIDVKFGIIMDVEASRAIRQAEVGAAKTMIERTEECFGIEPERLAADTAYGSAANLNWLVKDMKIALHIPIIDKSKRDDGTFSREDFTFYKEGNVYICPAFKFLTTTETDAFEQSCRERKRIEMLFAHLKRILRLGRLRLRGPRGAQFEFTLAAIAQNLRRLVKLVARPARGRRVRCVSVR
jgi:hypothetical protein